MTTRPFYSRPWVIISLLCLLTGCQTLGEWTDYVGEATNSASADNQEQSGNNEGLINILRERDQLDVTPRVLGDASLSTPTTLGQWLQENGDATGKLPHLDGPTFAKTIASTEIGEGNAWIEAAIAPAPLINDRMVVAMDGRGVISAHKRDDIEEHYWQNDGLASDGALLAGGLAMNQDRVIALSGTGTVIALNADDGEVAWRYESGEPLRSSVRLTDDQALVVTADSQLIALDIHSGVVRWRHRGVGGGESLFGTTLPATGQQSAIISYPSGDIFRLSLGDGTTIWRDQLSRPARTVATGNYTGTDANPVLDGRWVYAAVTQGMMAAVTTESGLIQWSLPIGTRHTPFIDKDLIFLVTEQGQLAAIDKYRGRAGWVTSLIAEEDGDEPLPRFYGPFLINNILHTFDDEGRHYQHKPLSGEINSTVTLIDSLAASPAFAGSSAYMVSLDATLHHID